MMTYPIIFTMLLGATLVPTKDEAGTGYLDYREILLDNGLRVITLEDFSCPIVVVDLWYHVGSKDENPERQGFAHMFEHMMFRGTDRLGPTDHFDSIRRTGGHCNGYTSFDQTVYIQTVPANQLEMALWLEAERMSYLKIDQAAFDTERMVVEEERRLGLNSPYGTLMEDALAEVFKVHPYRWTPIGKISHLRASSVPELRSFWMNYYAPNNATLIIAGAVKHEDAQALARQYFEWIPPAAEPSRIAIREPLPETSREVSLKIKNAPLPLVGIAYRTVPLNHPDRVLLELLATIVGGGNSSRLYRNLVAENELAVGVQCMNVCLEQDGILALGAACTPVRGRMDETLSAIRNEIERVREKGVEPRELEKARNQMLNTLVTENLYVSNKARALGHAAVLEGDASRVNQRLARIQAATEEDLLRVAQEYLDLNRAMTFRVDRNLEGLFGKGNTNPEVDAPVTGAKEASPPPPGRTGAVRPDGYPEYPPAKPPLEFDPTPKYETKTLDNGLKVVVVENHEVPYVSMSLRLRAGAWSESKPGCASLALNMLTKGTRKYSEGALADELETYAVQLSGSAGMDDAEVSAGCMTEQVQRAMQLMREVVLSPKFDAKEFDKLREQVLAELNISCAEPSYLASRELQRQLYGEHPYARTVQGEIDDIKALKVSDLKKWWATCARPDMAWLCFSGDIGMQEALGLAEDAFGSWKAKSTKPSVEMPLFPEQKPTHIYLVDKAGDQSQIRIAARSITRADAGYFTSRVAGSYFGGAFGSRLNETLRVKKGLTYGAQGGFYPQRMAGEFRVATFTKIESTPEAIRESLAEIRRLQQEPPTQKELDTTKAFILGSFAGDRETPQAIMSDLWLIESEGLPQAYYKDLLSGVQATDAAACASLAQRTLDADRMVIVVVGPAEALAKQLETIAPVTVLSPESRERRR